MFRGRMGNSLAPKFTFVLLVALSCFGLQTFEARADKKPSYGRIEVSTTPGGYPILIDGRPSGETTEATRVLDLPPGLHTVEILMPNGQRWTREFNILAARRYCIALNYRPRPISIAKSPCPYPVNVSAPATVNEGDVITFSSDVSYPGTSALNYTWTVSPAGARILSGAGTPSITVDSTGLGNKRIAAILVVDDGSGESACRQTAQAATNVMNVALPVVLPRKFDEFPSVAFDDDKARLDNLAIELQNTPNATGYIIAYGGRTSRMGQADRLGARAKDYLVKFRGMDASRIVVVNGGYRDTDYYELWIVPQGAQTPQASPTVDPSQVRPGPAAAPTRRAPRRRRGQE